MVRKITGPTWKIHTSMPAMTEFPPTTERDSLRTLPDAIEQFLQEFACVENRFVPTAMSALTDDQTFIDRAQSRLELPARLTLLKRMAMVRDADSSSIALIECVIEKTSRLQEKRESLARSSFEGDIRGGWRWVPTQSEVRDCALETLAVQRTLTCVADKFRELDAP